MLTRDPFRHLDPPRKPRHRKRHTGRNAVAAIGAAVAMAGAFTIATQPAGHAGDTGRMVARVATRAVAGFTPSRPPLSHGMRSQASRGRYGPVRGTSRVHDGAGR